MARIENDAYYTPQEIIKFQVEKTLEVLTERGKKVTSIIDPCTGPGLIKKYIDKTGIPAQYYDIEPQADFVEELNIYEINKKKKFNYEPCRLFMGNTPYELMRSIWANLKPNGDYLSFILYGANYNYTPASLEEDFELIYSKDLGYVEFSGETVPACFNIYVRKDSKSTKKESIINIDDYVSIHTMARTNKPEKQKWNRYNINLEERDVDLHILNFGRNGQIFEHKDELEHCSYLNVKVHDEIMYDYFNSQHYQDLLANIRNPTGKMKIKKTSLTKTRLLNDIKLWLTTNHTFIEETYESTVTTEIPTFDSITLNQANEMVECQNVEFTNNTTQTQSLLWNKIWKDEIAINPFNSESIFLNKALLNVLPALKQNIVRNKGVFKLGQAISQIQRNMPENGLKKTNKRCLHLGDKVDLNHSMAEIKELQYTKFGLKDYQVYDISFNKIEQLNIIHEYDTS